ncbi:dynamin family protein [Ectobacillus ponti]|uniref:Dynamin family protein n=1 Tax=Ectobacillus ponti TaxID=2961894 RepID=A0AA41X731_9BACI|nr:dynamin family protein [Ectobacillus ponti]MCP8967493.1 dynamin family protein [Ectobacillus ponti]
MNELWLKEKNHYISVLEDLDKMIAEIVQINERSVLVSNQAADRLKEVKQENRIYKEKLEKDDFEIAIVGLEKAGKSTFANALIADDILPWDSVRCTFTSTELRYGENRAEVTFLTRAQFNERFSTMLKEVGFPNPEDWTFETLPIANFEEYFSRLIETNSRLYNEHVGKTEEDIKDCIKGKHIILEYLDKGTVTFESEHLQTQQFKHFITDPSKSRAVQNISIFSEKLENLRNVVIYDVPGFDSPTKIHENQTIERLKQADAIVLVTNIGETPNMLGTQLNMLLKESDHAGIKLHEKLFIFGNKIDKVNGVSDAVKNTNTLKQDAVYKFKIVTEERIFVGSAYAYLQKHGLLPGAGALQKLEVLELQDGIDDILTELSQYYRNERFEVLKKRIGRNVGELQKIFNSILNSNSNLTNSEKFKTVDIQLSFGLARQARESIKLELERLRDTLKEEIPRNKELTNKLMSMIDANFYFIDDQAVEEARRQVSSAYTTEFVPEEINKHVRKLLDHEFTSMFQTILVNIANENAEDIYNKIVSIFLRGLDLTSNNPYYDEIYDKLVNFLNELLHDVSYDERSFVHLINRFSSDLFDILILYPFGGEARRNKFYVSEQDFYSLAMYDDQVFKDKPYYMQPLIQMILSHREITPSTLEHVKDMILKVINDFPAIAESMSPRLEHTIARIAEEVALKGHDVEKFEELLFDKLQLVGQGDADMIAERTSRMLYRTLEQCEEEFSSGEGYLYEKNAYIEGLLAQAQKSKSKQETREEINTDIAYLIRALKGPVSNAIALEKSFLSTVIKQINLLHDKLFHEEFDMFIAENATKIRYLQFAEHETAKENYENRKLMLEKLKKIIRGLE